MKIHSKSYFTKKIFATLFLALAIFSSNTKPTYALFGAGDIVFDIPNTIQGTISAIANVSSAYNDAATFVNNWILGPIADALRISQMVKSGNFIRNLVLGSMGTNNALLISNPKQYFVNQGKASIRESLKNITDAKGVYGDAISGDEIRAARMKYDTKAQLTAITQSDRPQVIQKNLCSDDNLTKLTELAGSDDPQDASTYNTRTEELYAKLCDGDPQSDPELSKALLTLDANNPSVGGWNSFLTATQEGGSAVAKMRASTVIALSEQAKVAAKATDLTMGNGIKSETECGPGNASLQDDGQGGTFCPDGKETVIKNASQLDQSLKAAIGSPLKLLSDSYGSKGIFALIGNIASLIGTVNTAANSFQEITNSGTAPTTTTNNGVTTTTYATSTYTHTLTVGTGQQKNLADNIKKQTDAHLTDLSKLESFDAPFLASINAYGSKLSQGKSCYDSLITNFPLENIKGTVFPSLADNARVQSGLAFFNGELSTNNALKNKIATEFSLIATTRTLINDTITKITKSDSVEEIQDLYSNYTNRVEKENLPGMSVSMQRVSDSANFDEMVKNMTDPSGQVSTTAAECTQIGQAEAAARDSARSNN